VTIDTPKAAATIEEVAAAAGVSRSTVSRVVNGSTAVSPPPWAVERAIAELNYVPNRAARSLASRATMAIALVVPEDTTRFFGDPFFAAVVSGINARLSRSDYVLNLIIASDDPRDKTAAYVRSGAVDGAIVVSHHTSDTFIDRIAASCPSSTAGDRRARENDYYVDVDNTAGAYQATTYLIEKGFRRIAHISARLDARGHRPSRGLPLGAGGCRDRARRRRGRQLHGRRRLGRDARILESGHPSTPSSSERPHGARCARSPRARGHPTFPATCIIGFDDSPVATAVQPNLTTCVSPRTCRAADGRRAALAPRRRHAAARDHAPHRADRPRLRLTRRAGRAGLGGAVAGLRCADRGIRATFFSRPGTAATCSGSPPSWPIGTMGPPSSAPVLRQRAIALPPW
jgi:DNA-binding LacI/PurR family transcriptional regulator